MGKKNSLCSPTTKLILYITTASLASLLADLNHYLQTASQAVSHVEVPEGHLIKWSIILINFVLQGLIAWRAFIDDAHLDAHIEAHHSDPEHEHHSD